MMLKKFNIKNPTINSFYNATSKVDNWLVNGWTNY